MTIDEQISVRPLHSERRLIPLECNATHYQPGATKMGAKVAQLTYIEKLAALTLQYLELSLPLPAALQAADADL
jgi:hypothetical protein